MRLKSKLKRTTKQYIIVALICIGVIGSAAISTSIITIGQVRDEYEFMLHEARREMESNKKTVYIALSDIRAGEILSTDKVEQKTVYSTQPVESYITKDELGKSVMIDIPQNTHIIKTMLAKNSVSSVLREVEYDVIYISSNIMVNDYVDVRIAYPNGENYIVMSKKPLKGLEPGTPVCYIWVDEEEILRMSAAIVDAGLYQGSRLFITKYIEPNIQEASLVTYTPNIAVLSLIENDPNIVDRYSQVLSKEVRKAMENRLAKNYCMDVSAISWEIDSIESGYLPVISDEQSIEDASNIEVNQGDLSDKDSDEIDYKEEAVDNDNNKADIKSEKFFPELGITDIYDNEKSIYATEG